MLPFYTAKVPHNFLAKNIIPIDSAYALSLNKSSINGFVKLMMLWIMRPWWEWNFSVYEVYEQ